MVTDPDTRAEDWSAKSFGIRTEGEALRLYADENAKDLKAAAIGSVLQDGTPMVMKISSNMAKSLVADYAQKSFIDRIWLRGRAPIAVKLKALEKVDTSLQFSEKMFWVGAAACEKTMAVAGYDRKQSLITPISSKFNFFTI